jgi:hypothetical protein
VTEVRSLHHFAVKRYIEALGLDILRHPQADRVLDPLQDDHGHDRVVGNDQRDALDLIEELGRVALR